MPARRLGLSQEQAVPVMAGWALVVLLPFAGAETRGAAGGVLSTVKVLVFEPGEVFPAASRAVTRTV